MRNTSVLFVCLGNICRSPTAEGIFRKLVEDRGLADAIHIDSAGTGAWHVGQQPDPRAIEAARARGIDLTSLRGRQVQTRDFSEFDYVLAMDHENYANLTYLAREDQLDKLFLFLEFAQGVPESEVPDPYYEGGFPRVFDLIENASEGLLQHILERHQKA